MNKTFSHADHYIAKLKNIELQIIQNQLREATNQLNLLASSESHDPRLFLLGAMLAKAAGNPEGVIQAARKAHQLAPQWPVATVHLAGVLADREEVDEAMAAAERAVQLTAVHATSPGDAIELLTKAASIAQRFGHHIKALAWLRLGEQINPEDVNTRQQIGRSLVYSGDPESAIAIFDRLLEQMPGTPSFLGDRLRACLAARQNGQAVVDAESLLAIESSSEVYRFYLDIAHGITPKTQPASLIAGLVDGVADQYEHERESNQGRELPSEVARMIYQWHPDTKGDILDLGCGAGELGACLGVTQGALVGVDLSNEKVRQASERRVYDRIHQVNLLDALQRTPDCLYHVITALDVLDYVGDLETVIPDSYRILVPGGRFVFSFVATDASEEADYALSRSYRYKYRQGYVQRLLDVAGFEEFAIDDRKWRPQAGQPTKGFLVTARKGLSLAEKTVQQSPKNAMPPDSR